MGLWEVQKSYCCIRFQGEVILIRTLQIHLGYVDEMEVVEVDSLIAVVILYYSDVELGCLGSRQNQMMNSGRTNSTGQLFDLELLRKMFVCWCPLTKSLETWMHLESWYHMLALEEAAALLFSMLETCLTFDLNAFGVFQQPPMEG